ncbi:3-ketoacyl-(acyl-carrier-protein) reductase [compost metagenome]
MSARFDYTAKTVMVTGGAQGIGLGIVEAFARAGAHVSASKAGVNGFIRSAALAK